MLWFSYCENCLSLLCLLSSLGVLIKLFEIKDRLKTPPNQENSTRYSCRVIIKSRTKVMSGICVSGFSEAAGILVHNEISALFSG